MTVTQLRDKVIELELVSEEEAINLTKAELQKLYDEYEKSEPAEKEEEQSEEDTDEETEEEPIDEPEEEEQTAVSDEELEEKAREVKAKKVKEGFVDGKNITEERVQPGSKAEKMRKRLSLQPKVTIMVPLDPGEPKGSTISVTINGYRTIIRKNVYVELPKQVADMIKEHLQMTDKALADDSTSLDEKKAFEIETKGY